MNAPGSALTARRRRRRLIALALVLLSAFSLGAGYYLGQHAAYREMGVKPKAYRAMQAELVGLHEKLQSLVTELDIQRTRNEVDRQSLELVRKDMAAQQEELAALEEGLAFYRSLIAPGEIAAGLSLRRLELVATQAPEVFLFRVVVQQEARKHDLVKGQLNIVLSGEQNGAVAEYSLAELSEDFEEAVQPLRFRYFQAVEGRLTLPEGFEPRVFTVVAKTSAPRELEVREEFPWRLDERFTHVGK
jgi:hypothetical protein